MFQTSVTTSNGEKLYLATFEFVSGEYEQFFEKAFYAKDEEDLKNKIPVCRQARHEYLINYYGEGNISEIDEDIYLLFLFSVYFANFV